MFNNQNAAAMHDQALTTSQYLEGNIEEPNTDVDVAVWNSATSYTPIYTAESVKDASEYIRTLPHIGFEIVVYSYDEDGDMQCHLGFIWDTDEGGYVHA